MGLDISNEYHESYDENISYYINKDISDKYRNVFLNYQKNGEYDKILNEVTTEHIDTISVSRATTPLKKEEVEILNDALDTFKETVERSINIIKILKNSEVTEDDKVLVKKYLWIYDDDAGEDSRMGSYSIIHYGRKFADLVDKYYTSKGFDISNNDQPLTREETETLLVKIEEEGTTSYSAGYFDNLCNHSDCEGLYAPTQERIGFDIGSSIKLLKELDTLYEVKAVEQLKAIKESIETEYNGEYNIRHAPQEAQILYRLADNCEWVIRKMLYHAVSSVDDNEIICFC